MLAKAVLVAGYLFISKPMAEFSLKGFVRSFCKASMNIVVAVLRRRERYAWLNTAGATGVTNKLGLCRWYWSVDYQQSISHMRKSC